MTYQNFNENNLITLSKLPDNSIDLIVTSPPYDDIIQILSIDKGTICKKYETKSALRNYKGYSWDIQALVKLIYQKLKPGGVVVWVMKDPVVNKSETLSSCYTRIIFHDEGFITHDTMIFEKHNFSNPCKNRFHDVFEYKFIFSKGIPKTFNPIMDREVKYAGQTTYGKNTVRLKDGSLKERAKKIYAELGKRFNIFKYKVGTASGDDKITFKHPAPFPLQLALDHINIWSNPSDTVYDPFSGSGTVGIACAMLNRNFIGSEVSKSYCDIFKKRLTNYSQKIK